MPNRRPRWSFPDGMHPAQAGFRTWGGWILDPIRHAFPGLRPSDLCAEYPTLTVAGAVPESHRLPNSPDRSGTLQGHATLRRGTLQVAGPAFLVASRHGHLFGCSSKAHGMVVPLRTECRHTPTRSGTRLSLSPPFRRQLPICRPQYQ